MTYNEWYEGLSQEKKTAIKAYKNRHTDEVQYTKYVKRLGGENMPKTLDLFQKMKYNDSEKWGDYKYYYRNIDGRPIEYVKIDRELSKLGITNKGRAYPVEQLEVNGWRDHAEKRIVERKIDKAEALSYKENAIGMLVKYPMPQTQYNYYSYKGVLGVRAEDKIICTAYSDKEFKEETKKILEVMNKWLNL